MVRSELSIVICAVSISTCLQMITARGLSDQQFKTILTGRCTDYQRILHREVISTVKDCADASSEFEKIFSVNGAACQNRSYDTFVRKLQHTVPKNKGLLWSGVSAEMKQVSSEGNRFYPIRLTLAGYMLDDVSICDSTKGIYSSRPGCSGCNSGSATTSFWEKASEYYAKSLSGNVTIMLSSRENSTFYRGSILARIELPSLSKNVKHAVIWPVRNPSTSSSVTTHNCGEDSLKELEDILKASGRTVECDTNAKVPRLASCVLQPDYCSLPNIIGGSGITKSSMFLTLLLPVSVFLLKIL